MIRLAEINDLEIIMKIVTAVIQEMQMADNNQWDKNYPHITDFRKDLDKNDLYVSEINEKIAGFICINYLEPIEYQNVNWSVNEKPIVIHRMAVNPVYRNQGIGSMLMNFAEELALSKEVNYLRSDTNSLNPKMNALFRKMNYQLAGEIHFLGKSSPFNCYEKVLSGEMTAHLKYKIKGNAWSKGTKNYN
jgi:GNAT superfamily N-acetyltransferase